MSEHDKAMMLDIIIDEYVQEYNQGANTEDVKKYHSKAEKVGYEVLVALESNGFLTGKGIQG